MMIGNCPNCASDLTCDGENLDHDAGDTTEGVCVSCGFRWCLECGDQHPCCHWQEWSEYCKLNGLDEETFDDEYEKWLAAR
jgi:hypothetical protein